MTEKLENNQCDVWKEGTEEGGAKESIERAGEAAGRAQKRQQGEQDKCMTGISVISRCI
jgi:hypothetical protein